MLFWKREQPPSDDRWAEIARLEALRDQLLAEAPGNYFFGVVILSLMFLIGLPLLLFVSVAPPNGSLWPVAFVVVWLAMVAFMLWRRLVHWPGKHDSLALSDLAPDERGDPRAIQAKIDKLMAQAHGPWG